MKIFLKGVGCSFLLSSLVAIGDLDESVKSFTDWFKDKNPIDEVKGGIASQVYRTLGELDEQECLLLLKCLGERIEDPLRWLLEKIESCEMRTAFFEFVDSVCWIDFCRLYTLNPVIECPEESRLKVGNLLAQWIYIDESVFCQKLETRLKELGLVKNDPRLEEDAVICCIFRLDELGLEEVREKMWKKGKEFRVKECKVLIEARRSKIVKNVRDKKRCGRKLCRVGGCKSKTKCCKTEDEWYEEL